MKQFFGNLLGPLGRIPLKRAAGVHVMDGQAHVAVAVRTVMGYEVEGILSAPLEGSRPGQVIGDLIVQAAQRFGALSSTAAGIPSNDVYFEAKPMNRGAAPEQYQTPEALATILPAALSPNTLLVNLQPITIAGTHHFLITACKRTVVYNGIQTFAEAHRRAGRFEPVPWALLRQSFLHASPVSAENLSMRLLVGPKRCMGYLLQGDRPVAWFAAPLPRPDDREAGMLSMIRSMENHARTVHSATLDRILVQGLDEDASTSLSLSCGLAVETIAGPALDGGTIAIGLALSALDPGYPAPNLADKLQAPDTLWALLNHFEAGMVALSVAVMSIAMMTTSEDLRRKHKRLMFENDEFKGAGGQDVAALTKEKTEQKEVAEATAAFLDRRNQWAATLVAIAEIVPGNSRYARVFMRQPPRNDRGPSIDRELTLECLAPEEKPVQINFKTHPWLGKMYPTAQLTGLARTGGSVMRTFNIEAKGTGPVLPDVPVPGAAPARSPAAPGGSPTPGASPSPAPAPSPKGGG